MSQSGSLISGGGGSVAITSVIVDANTPPGTNPVVPSALGIITIEAAAVAAHSVPIETRSRAPNAFKTEVQEASAVAASDATKSGIAHFNSAQFTVDANGFVSASGSVFGETITGQSGGALSPTAGNWNIFGGTSVAGTSPVVTSGSVSTLTTKVQISQAIASTDATKIGLSNFDSAYFTVDANGFVSSANPSGFPWVDATSGTQALLVNHGYVTDNAGGVIYTLPATAVFGSIIKIVGKLGLATITPNANQQILIGATSGAIGATGTALANNVGDCLEIVCITGGSSSVWRADSVVGTWTLTT